MLSVFFVFFLESVFLFFKGYFKGRGDFYCEVI